MMCSLYICIPSSSCTPQFNLILVVFTLNLQSLFLKVKLHPEILFHFWYPSASIGGYFFARSWSPPLRASPPIGVWQANKCPTSLPLTFVLKPQADGQGADLPWALMLLPQGIKVTPRIPEDFRQNTQGQNMHWSTQALYWEVQIVASCRFIVKSSTFSQCSKVSD